MKIFERSSTSPEIFNKYSRIDTLPTLSTQNVNNLNLSIGQSNVHYIMFFMGAFIYFLLDTLFIYKRRYGKMSFEEFPKFFLGLLMINCLLWVDFNEHLKKHHGVTRRRYQLIEDLMQYATDILVCIIFIPLMALGNRFR